MEKYIIFKSDDQKFAILIAKTERILQLENVTKVMDVSSYILGVIQYNGQVLPIIDSNQRFFNEKMEQSTSAKIIVIEWENKRIGLAVDDVLTIETIEKTKQAEVNQPAEQKGSSDFLDINGELITVVSSESIVFQGKKDEIHALIDKVR